MSKRDFGPNVWEAKVYLWIGLGIFALTLVALALRGRPGNAVGFEMVGLGAVFSGGMVVWAVRRLRHLKCRKDAREDE